MRFLVVAETAILTNRMPVESEIEADELSRELADEAEREGHAIRVDIFECIGSRFVPGRPVDQAERNGVRPGVDFPASM